MLAARQPHPNVLGFIGLCLEPRICIVTEYCARGTAASLLTTAAHSPERAAELDCARRLNMVTRGR